MEIQTWIFDKTGPKSQTDYNGLSNPVKNFDFECAKRLIVSFNSNVLGKDSVGSDIKSAGHSHLGSSMSNETSHAYVLVVLQPGKEQEFANEIISKGLILDSKVEKMDFVHGSFDFIVILSGNTFDIDRRILEMRKLPYVRRTETLIPFDMLNWDDVSAKLREGSP